MARVTEKQAADPDDAGRGGGGKDADTTRTRPAEPVDDLVTTSHEFVTSSGTTTGYTATAGRVVLREEVVEDDAFRGTRAKAEMSVVSYVLHGADAATRPVTFAFNGGPGSSSVWLHLGLLGPRRVLMGDAGALLPPPYGLGPNPQSLLAESDLVFIDPVSTGFSRATDGTKPADYHGYQRDLESVGELIRLWTTRNGRWMSPKFLAGESYGTTRAAALADHLQTRYGLYLNGLMLISSVLDMGSIALHGPDDRGYANFLPTYAAIAHYHGKHGNRPLADVLADAEEFAARDYPSALKRGSRLTRTEFDDVADRVAALAGLSPDYVRQANLRVEHQRFFAELLRDRGLAVGRIDGRFTGPLARGTAERNDADPSMDAISGPYAAAFNHYVRDDLGYASDLHYEQIADVSPWSYSEFEGRPVDVSGRLARAMRRNPHLKVQVAYGWHDGATPYFAAQEVFAHLDVPADLQANISHVYYPAGHMMYVHEDTRVAQSADLAHFVRAAAGLDGQTG
jgi:carboxypeptidase C (cathepsin A)